MTRDGDQLIVTAAVGVTAAALLVRDYLTTPFDELIESVAGPADVNPEVMRALARHESRFNPAAISPTNRNLTKDYGLFQINEVTAKRYGITDPNQLLNPNTNATLAARLLADLRRELGSLYSVETLVAAYNAGSPTIKRSGITNPLYVAQVMAHFWLYTLARLFR